ncbi:hypothetical protein X275_08215 [Marinitoga sp. 1197]|uniref:hypothetical protein n=1 Tax=Marinitoga sp. 1197 TaxID=1428449 RepID=UPI000641493C|nr:hypothetical protein [Marinitoga sp. 1197]KLO21866.1 hypothetical protein X275_08215 [Marinitoga sp. 1197]
MGFNPFGNLPVINMADIANKNDLEVLTQKIDGYIYKGNKTLYWDPTNGDDTIATGSDIKPYKTLAKLLNDLPDILLGSVNVMIKNGIHNISENISQLNKYIYNLNFDGLDNNQTVLIGQLKILTFNIPRINIYNITLKPNDVENSFIVQFYSKSLIFIRNCIIDGNNSINNNIRGLLFYYTTAVIRNTMLKNFSSSGSSPIENTGSQCLFDGGTTFNNNNYHLKNYGGLNSYDSSITFDTALIATKYDAHTIL